MSGWINERKSMKHNKVDQILSGSKSWVVGKIIIKKIKRKRSRHQRTVGGEPANQCHNVVNPYLLLLMNLGKQQLIKAIRGPYRFNYINAVWILQKISIKHRAPSQKKSIVQFHFRAATANIWALLKCLIWIFGKSLYQTTRSQERPGLKIETLEYCSGHLLWLKITILISRQVLTVYCMYYIMGWKKF